MELIVDLDSAVPVYEQLRTQVTELVESGALPVGYPLPAIRDLAAELGLAPGTIAHAYRRLRQSGVVTASRAGTTVAARPALDERVRQERLADAAIRLVGTARRLGASDAEVNAAIAAALHDE